MAFYEILSEQEKKIADLLLAGHDNPSMAKELGLAQSTIKAHMNRMFIKCGVGTDGVKRVKLAVLLYREQLARENK